jgi:copper chaperone
MHNIVIPIENLKCHGCAATIIKEINKIKDVHSVDVNVETSQVSITGENPGELLEVCRNKLLRLGYPEAGSNNSTITKAKSYISCAIGRLSEKDDK